MIKTKFIQRNAKLSRQWTRIINGSKTFDNFYFSKTTIQFDKLNVTEEIINNNIHLYTFISIYTSIYLLLHNISMFYALTRKPFMAISACDKCWGDSMAILPASDDVPHPIYGIPKNETKKQNRFFFLKFHIYLAIICNPITVAVFNSHQPFINQYLHKCNQQVFTKLMIETVDHIHWNNFIIYYFRFFRYRFFFYCLTKW